MNSFEKALYNWFVKQTKHFSITSHHHPTIIANHHHHNYTTIAHNNNNNNYHHHNHTNTNRNHHNHATTNIFHHHNSTTATINNNNNRAIINNKYSYNKNNTLKKENLNNLPSKSLIPHYPHFLRHKDEFFRKITVPTELEDKKEDIFLLSNIHFQTEYFQSEAEKWKI
ncbi:unnamed protein product, partial [Rotaria sp. Silwood2]